MTRASGEIDEIAEKAEKALKALIRAAVQLNAGVRSRS